LAILGLAPHWLPSSHACISSWLGIQVSTSDCVCQENSFTQTSGKLNTLYAGPRWAQLSLPFRQSDSTFPTQWLQYFLFSYHLPSTEVV